MEIAPPSLAMFPVKVLSFITIEEGILGMKILLIENAPPLPFKATLFLKVLFWEMKAGLKP